MMTERLFRWLLLPIFVAANVLGCDRTEPRVAPRTTVQAESDGVEPENATEAETQDEDEEKIIVPSPSSELLGIASECTVRLVGEQFQGSGVIVHRKENEIFILTVAHGVRLEKPSVQIFSLLSYPRPELTIDEQQVQIVSISQRPDLALLKAEIAPEKDVVIAKLAKSGQPDYAYSSGCVGSQPPKIQAERLLRAEELTVRLVGGKEKRFMWETSNPPARGRSGGPLLTSDGTLLGITLGQSGKRGYFAHLREISRYFIDNGLEVLVTCPEMLNLHLERK